MKEKTKDNILKQVFVTQTGGVIDISQKISFWDDFAKQTGGVFKVKQTVSKCLTLFNLLVPIENGHISFQESDTRPLKVECEIFTDKNIEFTIAQKDFFDRFLQIFVRKTMKTSNVIFDKKYSIQSNNEKTIANILHGESIIDSFLQMNIFSISCEYSKKKSTLKIMGIFGRNVNSIDEMMSVYFFLHSIIKQIK